MNFAEFAAMDKPEERAKRKQKAASGECTPISIDHNNQCGTFSGSSGRYRTWLSECECVDFQRRKLPCKHMYRLASELGIYEVGKLEADAQKRKTPKQEKAAAFDSCVSIVDSYPDPVQQEIWAVLASRYKQEPYVCYNSSLLTQPLSDGLLVMDDDLSPVIASNTQKRTVDALLESGFVFPEEVRPTKKARYEWCLNHAKVVCSIVYPDASVVRPAGLLETANRKMYTYLNRKFRPDDYSTDYWFCISGVNSDGS